MLAAPIDDLWHRLFGLDVTIWSPPHLLGIFGAAVNTVGCLLIATEVYRRSAGGRLLAAVLFGAMLYGTLHLVVDPSNLVAYRRGGVFFYTLAFLSALILPARPRHDGAGRAHALGARARAPRDHPDGDRRGQDRRSSASPGSSPCP